MLRIIGDSSLQGANFFSEPIEHVQTTEEVPDNVEESSCYLQLQQLADLIYVVALNIFVLFFIIGFLSYKCFAGESIFPLEDERADIWFRRMIYQDREINSYDEVGLETTINPEHLSVTKTSELEKEEFLNAPEIDIHLLNQYFRRINITDPHHPYYVNPVSLIRDSDTPATFAQLKVGLESAINAILANTYLQGEALEKYFKHICFDLTNKPISPRIQTEILIGLAKAGHRGCPTRLMEEAQTAFGILKERAQPNTLPEQVAAILQDTRQEILYGLSEGDVHVYGEYLLSIGSNLGIEHAEFAYNDNPILMYSLRPQNAFSNFFYKYTEDKIIDSISLALNGHPKPGNPLAREERKISQELVNDWFSENIPADYFHAMEFESRKVKFLEEFVYDTDTGIVKRDAVRYLLVHLNILRSEIG
jgi:hypothetical protein